MNDARRSFPAARLVLALGASLLLPAAMRGQEPAQRRPVDNPAAREEWFLRGRQSPDRLPAAEHLRRAFQQRRAVRFAQRRVLRGVAGVAPGMANFGGTTGSGTWTELGPRPLNTSGSLGYAGGPPQQDYGDLSGRVTAIAIDPSDATGNTVYVGAAYGGLWKSTNAMSSTPTFTPLTDSSQVPTLAVGAIGLDGSTGPTTIFIGTGEPNDSVDSYYGEGILESSDGGKTWSQVTSADNGAESFIGMGFSKIIFDAANPQVVLSAVSDHTAGDPQAADYAGIYRSTDHGATWALVLQGASATDGSATDLAYDPAAKTYYAALTGNGIYKSTDQGATWTAVASPFAAGVPATQLDTSGNPYFFRASLAVQNGTVYALIADSAGDQATPTPCTSTSLTGCDTGLVQSTNAGQTWTPIPMPDTSLAPGGQTNLYCETNGGGAVSCQGGYDQDIAAPATGGLVIGGLDLWSVATVPATATGNGISNAWVNLTNAYGSTAGTVHSDQHAITMLNASTWFIGNDGGVWSTADAGSSWQNLNATLGNIQFESVTADQQNTGVWFGGSQDNGTEKLTGPGETWTRFYLGDGGFTAANPLSPLQYFLAYTGVALFRSDDAGGDMNNSPQDVVDSSVIPDAADFYVPYLVMPAPNTSFILLGTCRVWAGPDDNTVPPFAATSPTSGGWYTASNDLTTGGSGSGACASNGDYITDLASAANDPDVAWAVTDDGQAQVTTDLTSAAYGSPAAWTNVAANMPVPSGPLSSVAINPINPNVVYVGAQGFAGVPGQGHVFKTSDGGNTWTDITGNLPDAPVNWIMIDPNGPNNDIYVASDVGVFVATDGGVTGEQWEQVGQGLPNTAVFQLALSPSTWTGSRELAAATHGRGMWEIAPLPTPDFTLSATPSSQTVLAGAVTTFTVTATGENGEAGPIGYTCTAPAAGCTVSPASAAPGMAVTVTLAAGAVAQGLNTVTISANEVNLTHTVSATITGTPFTLAAAPGSQTVLAGAGASLTITAQGGSGFTGSIALACTAPTSGCTVSPASITPGGSAAVTVAAAQLPSGSDTITVTGTSGSTVQTASSAVTVQDFAMAAAKNTASVSPGQAATYNLTLTSAGGFSGAVALACTGAPSEATCTVAPASVTPTNSGASAVVTVTTTAASGIVPLDVPPGDNNPPWRYALVVLLAALLAAGFAAPWDSGRRRPARRLARVLLWTAILGATVFAAGCGGGSSSSPPPSNPGTTAGSYTLTVKGASGSLSHSVSLTLTVQ